MKGAAHAVIGLLMAASLALPSAAPAQQTGENLQVFLVTMGPGAEIYERFGHDAIWVRDTVAHVDVIYNYGMFSFGGTSIGDFLSFAARFAMGPQQYWLGADSSMDYELALYRSHGRDLVADELNLTPGQRADLASRLSTNALPANRYYAYDYFRDNCATRVRDMLDFELGGALKRATVRRPADGTLRFHTRRSITNDKLLFLGIDAAFGPRVDRPLDQWDEMFLPQKVQQRVKELTVPDGHGGVAPLVTGEYPLLTIGAYHVDAQPPRWTGVFLVIGLAVAGLIRLADSRRVTSLVGRTVGGAWLLLMGIGGVVLLSFWLFTQHVATYANHNLLLMSPLALCLVRSFWYRGGRVPGRWTGQVAIFLMASVVVGVILALIPSVGRQDDLLIAALVGLPTFVAALEALRRSNRRPVAKWNETPPALSEGLGPFGRRGGSSYLIWLSWYHSGTMALQTVGYPVKPNMHPVYQTITAHCQCGNSFETRSTAKGISVEVCAQCHPYFTGKQRMIDTAGRVDRFRRKYATAPAAPAADPASQG